MTDGDEHSLQQLCEAIKQNDLEIIKAMLSEKIDVGKVWEEERILPLSLACARGNVDIVKLLLNYGAEVNVPGPDGKTALHHTCGVEERKPELLEILDILIENGANINQKDNMGCTALYLACSEDDVKIVLRLLRAQCSINVQTVEGDSPIKVAIRNAEFWFFWRGRETPSATKMCDPNEFAPVQITKLLLKAEANPVEATFLPIAIQFGAVELVKELLELGMNVNVLDDNQRSPLGCACSASNVDPEVVKLLLDCGADVNKGGGWKKLKPLIFAYVHNSVEKIRILLSYGAYISAEEMTELISLTLSKSILENPEVIDPSSKELLSLRLLLSAGFRPLMCGTLQQKISQLSMCSSYDRIEPWIFTLLYPVHSLKECCRIAVRSCLQPSKDENTNCLPIPPTLKKFLQFL